MDVSRISIGINFTMISFWDTICRRVGDGALGWTLDYPRDPVIFVLGVCLGIVLCVVRRFTTDRQFLEQITADQKRLQKLIHAARTNHDHERFQRLQHIRNLVRMKRSQAELLSVGISILILAAVATWGQHRLGNLPWRRGDSVDLSIQTPPAAIGKVIHVLPDSQLVSDGGWIRKIRSGVKNGQPQGLAEWSFCLDEEPPPTIILKCEAGTVVHQLLTPQGQLAGATQKHHGLLETHVQLKPYRPLGLLPQNILPGVPGWAFLLMLVTTPVFLSLSRLEGTDKSD